MAACGSLQRIFENPLPENQTLLDSLSPWPRINPIEQSSFTEIFRELYFKESFLPLPSPDSLSSSYSSSYEENETNNQSKDSFSSSLKTDYSARHRKSDSFSSMNSESLQLCTEGLGFESSDDVEDLKGEVLNDIWGRENKNQDDQKVSVVGKNLQSENYISGETIRRSRTCSGAFPPPISCIGMSGKPWVCFKSYRQEGRFVLKEIRVESHEFLHACRENGRLTLHFVQPTEEFLEVDEEEEDEENYIENDGERAE